MAGVIYFAAASPGVLGGEDVVHGDGFVCPLVGSGVDLGLSNSGLKLEPPLLVWQTRGRLLAPPGTGWLVCFT